MNEINIFAHSLDGRDVGEWQLLNDHAQNVAELAAEFASSFGSSETARLLGVLHDMGKARCSFQSYLRKQNGLDADDWDSSDHAHSGAGACWVARNINGIGRFLAYPLAGHHAGLTDWDSTDVGDAALCARLDSDSGVLEESAVREWIECFSKVWLRYSFSKPWKGFSSRDVAFWVRMLYSCLVDADYLDTERFVNGKRAVQRRGFDSMGELHDKFFARLSDLQARSPTTSVNDIRNQVLKACVESAEKRPGLFSLSVPTGGGKTLSSTAFALRHACRYGKKRVIYVIPYTSIIEQTADVLRGHLGSDNVIEHHCNLDPAKETMRSRLAAENWDAPIVVTTAVQFFESLYACRSSQCRKLHNICDSVIILDESQLLPPEYLLPIAESIYQLSEHYGCSLVFSTATQTSISELAPLKDACIREIIPHEWDLYGKLKRTRIALPDPDSPRATWDEVAAQLSSFDQVLCVVNTRRDCRALFDLMPKGTIHLSASMCGEHRSRVIADIKQKLTAGEEVRVISTQLVEAGVDVDFPVVYRAFTGLPSIVQTAGRCNREGHQDMGRVMVFNPPQASPVGSLRWYEDAFRAQLAAHPNLDMDVPDVFPEFYRKFYEMHHDLGREFSVLLQRDAQVGHFKFRTASDKFNMIDSRGTQSVIVRYGDNGDLIKQLRVAGPKREIMRKLQRYTVTLPLWTFAKMLDAGGFVEGFPKSGVFVQEIDSVYSSICGLDLGWQGLTIDETII